MEGKRIATASIQVIQPARRVEEAGDDVHHHKGSSGCNSYFSTIDIPDAFPEQQSTSWWKTRPYSSRREKQQPSRSSRSSSLWNALRRRNSLESQRIFKFDEELDLPPLPKWLSAPIDSDNDDDDEGYAAGDDSETEQEDSDTEFDVYRQSSSVPFEHRSMPNFVTFLEKILKLYHESHSRSKIGGFVGSPVLLSSDAD